MDTSSFWYLPTNFKTLAQPKTRQYLRYLIYFNFIDFYRLLQPAVYLLGIMLCCELIAIFIKLCPGSGQDKINFCRSQERGMARTWRFSVQPHLISRGRGRESLSRRRGSFQLSTCVGGRGWVTQVQSCREQLG